MPLAGIQVKKLMDSRFRGNDKNYINPIIITVKNAAPHAASAIGKLLTFQTIDSDDGQ